jgi:hypothetical protein
MAVTCPPVEKQGAQVDRKSVLLRKDGNTSTLEEAIIAWAFKNFRRVSYPVQFHWCLVILTQQHFRWTV